MRLRIFEAFSATPGRRRVAAYLRQAMPICSYLVIPAADRIDAVLGELCALDGCEAIRAEQHDVIALVTETADSSEELALRRRVESIDGIFAIVLTFGELEAGGGEA